MRFGLLCSAQAGGEDLPPETGQGFRDYLDFNVEAEELGFHSSFLVEHHFTGWNQVSATLILLTCLAMRTTALRLGSGVITLPWRNPVLLAEEAATLDLISGGRLDFGIGKGYRHSEFNGFQVPQEEAEARFEEAIEVITRSWTERSRFSHRGRFWRFEDIVVEPPPTQRPHPPLWMAAGSPASIRRAAAQGFNLVLDQYASTEQIRERLALYRSEREAHGRPFDPMGVAGGAPALHRERSGGRRRGSRSAGRVHPAHGRGVTLAGTNRRISRARLRGGERRHRGARALWRARGDPLQAGGIERCRCRVRPAHGAGR
jgi:alkanesulfonate monooxygenase SsuD/methylene tetrahydromethanopterin reductase-like flavin-dependent oxidoreductase (luciferase family)